MSQLTLQQIKSLQPEQSGPRVFSELLQKLAFCFRARLVVGCKRFEAPEKVKIVSVRKGAESERQKRAPKC